MKITFQNWHSECTNSSDMFVFLFCFSFFQLSSFSYFFFCFGGLFFLLRVRTMVVGTQWLVLMYVFITVKYICILFCIIEFALGILLLAGLQVLLFLGGLVQEKWNRWRYHPFQICFGGFKIESARLLHYQSVLYLILHVKLPFGLLGLHFQSSFSHFKAYVSFFFSFLVQVFLFLSWQVDVFFFFPKGLCFGQNLKLSVYVFSPMEN